MGEKQPENRGGAFAGPPVSENKVPCRYCNTPTSMVGSRLCDYCWEIVRRYDSNPTRFMAAVRGHTVDLERVGLGNPEKR